MFSYAGRSGVQDFSAALREGNCGGGTCAGGVDRKSSAGAERCGGEIAGGFVAVPANPAGKADAEFVVFGVVTEYCVSLAVKGLLERGRRVAVVQDAIGTLKQEDGKKTTTELERLGARLTTADQALRALGH